MTETSFFQELDNILLNNTDNITDLVEEYRVVTYANRQTLWDNIPSELC